MISHKCDCKEYEAFYNKFYKDYFDDIESLLDLRDRPNFLKENKRTSSKNPKDRIVLWCCCKSHLAHRESDKFTIINKTVKASCTEGELDKTA